MPLVGLGTFQARGNECSAAVVAALHAGCRLIDTAVMYRNQASIVEALQLSGVKRSEVFITSKVPPNRHGEEEAYQCCLDELTALGTDYIDLMLIHWPGVQKRKADDPYNRAQRRGSWKALKRLHAEGKCRAVGVSNYQIRHLRELLEDDSTESSQDENGAAAMMPHVNQVELHPFLGQRELRLYCESHGNGSLCCES